MSMAYDSPDIYGLILYIYACDRATVCPVARVPGGSASHLIRIDLCFVFSAVIMAAQSLKVARKLFIATIKISPALR